MENDNEDYISWKFILIISAIVILFGLFVSGCATGKNTNTGQQKVAEDIKIPVKIAGIDKSINQETKTNLTAGGNITQNNESKMIVELNNKVLETYKELTNKYIELMRYIIWTLFGAVASALGSLISLVVWVIKFLLNQDKDTDEFMQKQITGK